MSPVFRHGGLRLYLLKLLDESPRHGYEVIRLLQDRFLGVYAPSPGTIYPRLARLEEDGLVTHEEVDGKKVYRITDKGRQEIQSRLDDLADLEEELTQSVRDVAREISQDVRQTVRSIREDLTWATRNVRRERDEAQEDARQAKDTARQVKDNVKEQARQAAQQAKDGTRQGDGTGGERASGGQQDARRRASEARRIKDEARRTREDMRERFRSQHRHDWSSGEWGGGRWADWAGWPGRAHDEDDEVGQDEGGLHRPFADFEQVAADFAGELSSAAWRASEIGEGALGDLRNILSDTVARIRSEVLRSATGAEPSRQAGDEPGKSAADGEQDDPDAD